MGSCMEPDAQKKYEFAVRFSPRLRQLFDLYLQEVQYINTSKLFASPSKQLDSVIDQYLKNSTKFNKSDLNLWAVDAVNKLHPLDYGTKKVTK